MNIIDKTLTYLFPTIALRREQARAAANILNNHTRRYEGASYGRRTAKWFTPPTSANSEVSEGLRKLVDRSRDLVRNNAYASRAIKVISTNVVGTGIIPNPATTSKFQKKKIKELWWSHFETPTLDFDGRLDIYGLQRLWMKTVAESGEVLILRRKIGSFPLKLQTLEGDYFDITKDTVQYKSGQNYIRQGIEYSAKGQRIAYHLFIEHPGDSFRNTYESVRVPAEDVIHVFLADRPGQSRGVPFASPVLLPLRDLDEYEDAQLIRQKIAACFAAFVTKEPESGGNADDKLERVEPGIVQYLSPGENVTFANPPATEGYSEFTKAHIRKVAIGFGVTYEALSGDYSMVNFSSSRSGWLEFQKNIGMWQNDLMLPALRQLWSWFMETASITAGVKPVTADWTMPRREMIQPLQELEAMVMETRNGFVPWSEQVRKLGGDPDDVISKITEDNKIFDENFIKLDCDGRNSEKGNSNGSNKEVPPNRPAANKPGGGSV